MRLHKFYGSTAAHYTTAAAATLTISFKLFRKYVRINFKKLLFCFMYTILQIYMYLLYNIEASIVY